MLWPVLEDEDEGQFMAALINGYFDESGKAHQEGIGTVVFSGFVSKPRSWKDFDEHWDFFLTKHHLKAFHFSEHKRNRAMVLDFVSVMNQNIEFGISVGVEVRLFNTLPEDLKIALGGDPHYLVFKAVVSTLLLHVVGKQGNRMTITCDEDEDTFPACYDWYRKLKGTDSFARRTLVSFATADDKAFSPLQASDLFAGISRAEADSKSLESVNEMQVYLNALNADGSTRHLNFQTGLLREDTLNWLAGEWQAGRQADLWERPI
jgi:hypothetical protein